MRRNWPLASAAMHAGDGVICVPEVVSSAEVAQLLDASTKLASAQCEADGTHSVRMYVPEKFAPREVGLCDDILRRVMRLVDGEFVGMRDELFGLGAEGGAEGGGTLSELHELGELEFSPNEPAINVYFKDGVFTPHKDNCALTVLIPLAAPRDGAFQGGGTGFWGRSAAPDGDPSLVLRPEVGTAMLFAGHVTHAGMLVESGTRAVLVASFSRKQTQAAAAEALEEMGMEQGANGPERLVRRKFGCGTVQYYLGAAGEERLVRAAFPDGDMEHFEGAQGTERLVRSVLSNGDVEHFEGEADSERLVRRETANGEVELFAAAA